MSHDNPYASPKTDPAPAPIIGPAPPNELTPPGVWRCGSYLVMHKGAKLPDRCVCTGAPAVHRVKETLTKESGGNHFAFLLGQYGGAAYEMGVKKEQFFVEVPVGHNEMSRVWTIRAVQILLVVLGVAAIWIGIQFVTDGPTKLGLMAVGGVGLIVLAAFGPASIRRLSLVHNDTYYAWISGADESFLAGLEAWPFQRPRGV